MINDSQTNFLYLSEKLQEKGDFIQSLIRILDKHKISHAFLPQTRDIWAVDYMPIQVKPDKYIRFRYEPDYLQYKKYQSRITDSKVVCDAINIETIASDINLDGGNVIRGKEWVILTDKVFKENSQWGEMELIRELERVLECRVIIIPKEPGDYTGHADGMLRYFNDNTVLLNQYRPEDKKDFQQRLKVTLHNAGINWIEVPYNPYSNQSINEAHGLYINFLQIENLLLLPSFGLKEDDMAFDQFQQLFPGQTIETIQSTTISKEGGVLNCITWNIFRSGGKS